MSAKMNIILANEEAESGAVTADDLGKKNKINVNIDAEDDDG
jgi:hypothetical protein